MNSDEELQAGLNVCADTLIGRIFSKVPQQDPVAMDLFEQWSDSLLLAMKYAQDDHARNVAEVSLQNLLNHLKTQGITTF